MDLIQEIKSYSNSFLSFKIADEIFASHVSHVHHIMEVSSITEMPNSPNYMRGIIDLRGQALPIIDIRVIFGMKPTQVAADTCILALEIVINKESTLIGALVDSVLEVLEFDNKEILPAPEIGYQNHKGLISGIVKVDEKMIMILDMNLIFKEDAIISNIKQEEEIN